MAYDQNALKANLVHLASGATLHFSPATDHELEARPTVLVVHGYASSVFSTTYFLLCEELNKRGFHTCSLSLRGHDFAAGNIKTVSRADHQQDLIEAIACLCKLPFSDPKRLSAVGASYGAYILANSSSTDSIFQNMVFRAPALYPDEGWNDPIAKIVDDRNIRKWRQTFQIPADVTVLKHFSLFLGRVLFVLSELDEQMPYQVARSYLGARRSNRTIVIRIEEAGHVLKDNQRLKFVHIVAGFLEANTR